jgi:hypothetical protein
VGVIEMLFKDFDGHLKAQGYLAIGGQIIDASIVSIPTQHNTTAGIKMRRLNPVSRPKVGPMIPPNGVRNIRMPGGPKSMAKAITVTKTT